MIRILFLGLVLALAACTSVRIQPAPTMEVPAGLSLSQVESGIRQAITESNQRSAWSGGTWAVEKSQPGLMTVGLRVRQHYLQLDISYDEHSVTSRIISSNNLNQSKKSIHRKALGWQKRLDSYIYRRLTQLKTDH